MNISLHPVDSAAPNEVSVVILAAGRGTRLKNSTDYTPKCLVEVAGRPMLSRMLDELRRLEVGQIVIAVGYLQNQIQAHVARHHPELPVSFVENVRFLETGSAQSLHLTLERIPDHRHALIVEADVVLEPDLCGKVLSALDKVSDAATLLAPYAPELSGTFALVHKNHILSWCHESVRTENFPIEKSFKTVNITAVKGGNVLERLKHTLRETVAQEGKQVPLEYVMEHLIRQGVKIAAVTTGKSRWYEVDTPEDLEVANRLFSASEELVVCG